MKLTTDTKTILSSITRLRSVIHTRTTLPILSNVRIEANGKLRIAASNLDQCLEISMDAEIADKGDFTLPGHSLHAVLSCMDGPTVSLAKEKDSASITCGARTAKMQGLPVSEFPALSKPKGGGFTVPGEKLKHWLSCCLPAVSVDASRYVLNGVHMVSRAGKIEMEASDGHRLVVIESDVKGELSPSILPTMGAKVLAGLLSDGDVTVSEDDNTLYFSGDDWEFASLKIEGNFPNCKRLIPSDREKKIVSVRESLMDAIKYASLFITEKGYHIKLSSTPGCLTVSAKSDERDGEAQIEGFPKNAKITIAAKPSYLLDLLHCFDSEEITLELVDPCSPITVQQGEVTAILMPMRIS